MSHGATAAVRVRRIGEPRLLAPILVAAALVVFRSFVWVAFEQSFFDSDQAVIGLMAKHLAEGRAFPLFFYGQHYMLGVEAWMAAPLFRLAGASVFTLKLPLLAVNIAVAAVLLWLLIRTVKLTAAEALLTSAFFLIPAPTVAARLVEAQGANIEPFLYVLLLWLLRDRMVAFGLLAGFAFLHREFTAYAVVGIALVDVLTWRAFTAGRLRGYAKAAAMFGLVAVVVRVLKTNASLLGPGSAGTIDAGGLDLQLAAWSQFVCGPRGELLENLRWLAQENLAVIFNWKEDLLGPTGWSQTPAGHGWLLVVLLLASALAVVQIVRSRNAIGPQGQLGVYLTIVGAEAALAYSLLGCTVRDGTLIRYTLLTLYVPTGFLILFLASKPPTWMRASVLSLVALWSAASFMDTTRFVSAYVQHPPLSTVRQLVNYLEREGVRYGRGPYWIAYQLDFLSRERLTISSLDKVRVAEYQRIADEHDQQTVHVLINQDYPNRSCDVGEPFAQWCLQYLDRAKRAAEVP